MSDRARILEALRQTLEPMEQVLAFFEAGSRATGRYDDMSDLDLIAIVEDEAVAATAQAIEATLERIGPVARHFEIPQPAWHGFWQAFYHLQDTDPLLLIDLVIQKRSDKSRLLEPEMHGTPAIFFDKEGLVTAPPTDAVAFAERLRKRLPMLEELAEMFHPFVEKELRRGREVDALHFYQGSVISRLVEVLRIRYAPWRFNFGQRYLQSDLPPAVYAQVRDLVYVASPEDLAAKKPRAMALLRETLAELKQLDLINHLEAHRK